MSKATDLTIEVKANMTVDRETAERCLKILEWYCNDNKVFPIADRDSDGIAHFKFERRLRERGANDGEICASK